MNILVCPITETGAMNKNPAYYYAHTVMNKPFISKRITKMHHKNIYGDKNKLLHKLLCYADTQKK
jgi:hypothetical protein